MTACGGTSSPVQADDQPEMNNETAGADGETDRPSGTDMPGGEQPVTSGDTSDDTPTSDDSTAPGDPIQPQLQTAFEDATADILALDDRLFEIPYTDPITIGTTGSASYSGGAIVDAFEPDATTPLDTIVADLEIGIDFETDDFSGSVTNMVSASGDEVSGALTIATGGGVLNRLADIEKEFTFVAGATGALEIVGDTVDVDMILIGDFLGEDAGAVQGFVTGEAVSSERGLLVLDGFFVAE